MSDKIEGQIGTYFCDRQQHGLIVGTPIADELMKISNQLVFCYLHNTHFWNGKLKSEFLNIDQLYTIFKRRDHGDIPYKLSTLSDDLQNNLISRKTIDQITEDSIRDIKKNLSEIISVGRKSIIIESREGNCYLILEGNKRITSMYMSKEIKSLASIDVYIGKTSLPWTSMLSLHGMRFST